MPPGEEARTLPIEVLGLPGIDTASGKHRVSLTVTLDVSDADWAAGQAAGRAALALTLHNILKPRYAWVSVNGTEAIDLGARSLMFARAGDGGVTSGSVPLDLSALHVGKNTLTFSYTEQIIDREAALSGYRVLALALLLGERQVTPDLPADDPSSYVPVRTLPDAIERGRQYFSEVSRDGGPFCARCHADSGADLQYYGFSNRSIVERAMFHEFTREEAEDLASYIRTLPVAIVGRPYNSPFQPGPTNGLAVGAGYDSVLRDDTAFAEVVFGGARVPPDVAWDWAKDFDTFKLAAAVQSPTWFRWLPRRLDRAWFTRNDGKLATAEEALANAIVNFERGAAAERDALAQAAFSAAVEFMIVSVGLGKQLMAESDVEGRLELLRFAAVKLWDWSRRASGYDASHHGTPDRGPAYPYEVGFVMFEAAKGGDTTIPDLFEQTLSWWWTQLAIYPGRGYSTGQRPLNFEDVLEAAERAEGARPAQIAFLHLYGSWEESRGALSELWHTGDGPVRLLEVPMRTLDGPDIETLLRRFLAQEAAYLQRPDAMVLDQRHHSELARAWQIGCAKLSAEQHTALRSVAPTEVAADISECPAPVEPRELSAETSTTHD